MTGGSWLPGMLPAVKPPSGSELGLGEQRAVRPQGQEPPNADTVGAHRRRGVKVTSSLPVLTLELIWNLNKIPETSTGEDTEPKLYSGLIQNQRF